MAPSVEKTIAQFEMGLLHLQQNIDIPEISLAVHPSVTAAVKRAAAEGGRARVQDFADKIEDSTYLNTLQNLVNRWIREIQKVHAIIIINHSYCVRLFAGSYFLMSEFITKVLVLFWFALPKTLECFWTCVKGKGGTDVIFSLSCV